MEKKSVDTYYVLDLDRCLVDTDKISAGFSRVCEDELGVSNSKIQDAKDDCEQRGESFSTASYVRKTIGLNPRDKWENAVARFNQEVKYERTKFFMAGAINLLDMLAVNGLHHGILTYGDREWQQMKLDALELGEVPTLITDRKHKSHIMAQWQDESGRSYIIPRELQNDGDDTPLIAKSLFFVDDKPISFEGFGELDNAQGYLVNSKLYKANNDVELPSNVTLVSTLHEVEKNLSQK